NDVNSEKGPEYIIGEKDKRGRKIAMVHGESPSYVVYSTEDGGIVCEISEYTEHAKLVVKKNSEISSLVLKKLRNSYKKEIAMLQGEALFNALNSKEDENINAHFEPVIKFIDENGPINHVYGYGTDYIVFQDKGNNIQIQVSDKIDDNRT